MTSLYELYLKSPEEALERVFADYTKRKYSSHLMAAMYTQVQGIDGQYYGSFKSILKSYLEGRNYEIKFVDKSIGIFFLDAVYDPKTFTTWRFPFI